MFIKTDEWNSWVTCLGEECTEQMAGKMKEVVQSIVRWRLQNNPGNVKAAGTYSCHSWLLFVSFSSPLLATKFYSTF